MFSERLPTLVSNALADAVAQRRRAGAAFVDLTVTNPTAVGLDYPHDLLAPLAAGSALTYAPDPLGLTLARDAVAADYARHHVTVDPSRVVLTASTSEAYGLLFKLLCGPGDEVLIPQPSYPLFDLLTRLDVVTPIPYPLDPLSRWWIDRDRVERALTDRTRAILVVSPNNPTGSTLSRADAAWLDELCAKRKIAIISDEVFADFPLREATTLAAPCEFVRQIGPHALSFTLGGLSKSAGLPQVKLGWMVLNGPAPLVQHALDRLELICDTYLSVSTPVQMAAPSLLSRAGGADGVRAQIHARVRRNMAALQHALTARPDITLLDADAGWSAVIQVPATEPEEQLVLRLLNEHGVLVHPGYFFDFPREAFLVVSLLPAPEVFDAGIHQITK